jgi:MFS family permease
MFIPEGKKNLLNTLKEPFKDENYRRLIRFLGVWSFAINLAAPFFTVYMLQKLELSITLVIIFTVINQLTTIIFLKIWGILIDRFSNKSVLKLCCPLLIACIFLWTFTTLPNFYLFTIPLLILIHISMGIATAGTVLATQNICLKLTPKGKGTSYLAATTVVTSLALGISPLIGGLLADYFIASQITWTLEWTTPNGSWSVQTLNIQGFDFYFIFAFLIGLISLLLLAKVHEDGEIKRRIMIHELILEMKKTVKNLSSFGSITKIFPSYSSIIYTPLKRKNRKKIKLTDNKRQ